MTLSLFLLGPFRLQFNQQPHLLTRHHAALLGYLALQPHTGYAASRSRLAGTLWPEYEEDHARRLLSNALYRLQKQHPKLQSHLRLGSDTVSLQNIWVDAASFDSLCASPEPPEWQRAIELYRGQLMEELDANWLTGPRALLHEQYLTALARVCRHLEQVDGFTSAAALPVAQRWVQADPLNEVAHRTLMRLFARLGRTAAARRQFEQLSITLADELGVSPEPETMRLLHELPPSSPPAPANGRFPFVGRANERSQLLAHLDSLTSGKGGVVLIDGEAGIGKTTLLKEVAKTAVWRRLTHAWANTASAPSQPFAPLPVAIQALAQKATLQTAVSTLSPLIKQLLIPFLQPHQTNLEHRPSPFVPTPPRAAALRHLLQAWLRQEPILLLLDDLHEADDAFWALLPTLTDLCQERPLLLLLTFRGWEMRQNEAGWSLLQTFDSSIHPLRLTLGNLSLTETEALLNSFPLADGEASRLHQLSGGNPLLLRELLAQPEQKSVTLTPLLANRLAQLTPAAQSALAVAAVLGQRVDLPLWFALLDRPLSAHLLTDLLNSRFLIEEESQLRFQHELIRLHLYQHLPETERRALHLRLANRLQTTANSATLAHHFAEGEAWETAVYYFHRASEQALALNAFETAVRYVDRAQEIGRLHKLPAHATLPIRALDCTIQHQRQPSSDLLPTVAAIEAEAREHKDEETLLRLLLIKFDLLVGQQAGAALSRLGNEILQLTEGVGNLALEIDALCQISIKTAFTLGQAEEAIPFAQQAIARAKRQPSQPEQIALARLTLAACQLRLRLLDAAKSELTAVKKLLQTHPNLQQVEAEWLYLWGVVAQFSGEWETAYQIYLQSVTAHRKSGNFYALTSALYNAANHASGRGSHEEAILFAQEMVDLAEEQLAGDDYEKRLRYRSMLAGCYELAGEYEMAEATLAPLLPWLDADGEGVMAVRGWSVLGSVRFGQQRLDDAFAAHERAIALAKPLTSVTASPFLAHAEICHLTSHPKRASESLQEAKKRLNFKGRTSHSHTYFFYVRFLLEGKTADLLQSYDVMIEQSCRFHKSADQQQYVNRFSLHRDILAARAKLLPPPLTVQLARQDVPLGRSLKTADFVAVSWTVDAGEADQTLLAAKGGVALRRHRLQRLMTEAKAQGGRPTYSDLATALAVSERTIERDAKWLEKQGVSLYTRKKQRSPKE